MALLSTKTCGKHVGMNPQKLLGIDRYGEQPANHGLLLDDLMGIYQRKSLKLYRNMDHG